ncbi:MULTISPECIES: MupA/Atu3671 family FMN-dependent luciferase-like monooxygenase [Streptomyces]|uniref:MupA/Atu3671 family FMN-dependent luciferase-like monooxygenase n=1 Tax=Streptomyces TaxID=1883 RepID=UPI001E3C230C|nr:MULTISPECIES: MupA/Atu3671 family FMN-dependent luciferase-like monooxygenase [Streptomyces]UFQ19074.1 LLM class flavin-dependent oxidoreductase [Streptomyces huasconensis]WCL88693.1 LLM class flavin-dependent oxidoreductase [Streptomyces sp. JCM 35825]
MDFSLFYFANEQGADTGSTDRYGLLLEGAKFADTHGFTAVWTPERHFHEFGGIYPNPSVLGAAVAAVTERVGIRAGSVVAPLHHPVRIAEEWAVVDNLSGGRVGVSFASGWHPQDFALRPENFTDRKDKLGTIVEDVRELWRGGSTSVVDGAGETQLVRSYPRPVQAELPVWITSAGGPDTFRAAGRAGAGMLTHLVGQDLDQLSDKVALYREEYAAQSGSAGGRGHVVLMLHAYLHEDEAVAKETVRVPLTTYLRSFAGLTMGSGPKGRRVDPESLSPRHFDAMVERSFERYYDEGGLLGTVDKAVDVVERVRKADVDEIACLIDFGVARDKVVAGFELLDSLRAATSEDGR